MLLNKYWLYAAVVLCVLLVVSNLNKQTAPSVKTKTQTVKTKVRDVRKPDGTRVITTTKTEQLRTSATVQPVVEPKNWLIGPTYNFQSKEVGLDINRRILGPVFIGISIDRQEVKGKVLIEF